MNQERVCVCVWLQRIEWSSVTLTHSSTSSWACPVSLQRKILAVCWLLIRFRYNFSEAFIIVVSLFVHYLNKVSFSTLGLLCFIKCVCERERESVWERDCVYVCVWEECVCVWERESVYERVCVCVCEREWVCVWEWVSVCVCLYLCVSERERVWLSEFLCVGVCEQECVLSLWVCVVCPCLSCICVRAREFVWLSLCVCVSGLSVFVCEWECVSVVLIKAAHYTH